MINLKFKIRITFRNDRIEEGLANRQALLTVINAHLWQCVCGCSSHHKNKSCLANDSRKLQGIQYSWGRKLERSEVTD